jgi:hypothetical protein
LSWFTAGIPPWFAAKDTAVVLCIFSRVAAASFDATVIVDCRKVGKFLQSSEAFVVGTDVELGEIGT